MIENVSNSLKIFELLHIYNLIGKHCQISRLSILNRKEILIIYRLKLFGNPKPRKSEKNIKIDNNINNLSTPVKC